MEYIIIVILLLILLLTIFSFTKKLKTEKLNQQKQINYLKEEIYLETYNNIIKNESERVKEEVAKIAKEKEEELTKDFLQTQQNYSEKKQAYDTEISYLNQLLSEKRANLENVVNAQKEIIDNEINNYRRETKEQVDREVSEYYSKKTLEANSQFEIAVSGHNEKINNLKEEINQIVGVLDEYQRKRDSINAAILREKELEEREDFYRIIISDNEIQDIQVLRQIEEKLTNKEALNKLIYDVFVKRPTAEMIKRVLNGGNPSGIYKITYIPTGESYIGKSTDVSKRWTEHVKSCLNIGTIAHSSLHTKMAKSGLWKFTFELLEEVPKEKLSEREKYYIDFYNTKKMGLNQKEGG